MMAWVLALLALQTAPFSAVPQPTPTPYKEIGHVKSTPLCTTLHQLVVPFSYVVNKNDEAFAMMHATGVKYRSAILNQGGIVGHDDMRNGGMIAAGRRIDNSATQVFENLVELEKMLDQSAKDVPPKTDANVDSLRAHIRNVINLQRAIANDYEQFAAGVLDNQDQDLLKPGDIFGVRSTRMMLNGMEANLDAQANAPVGVVTPRPAFIATPPPDDLVAAAVPALDPQTLKLEGAGAVAGAMLLEESAVIPRVAQLARGCDESKPTP